MKYIFTFFVVLNTFIDTTFGQASSECPSNLSIFAEYAKVKNYDAAFEPWSMVFESCPELNAATFIYGERILTHKIKNDPAQKADYADQLMSLYDQWLIHFPSRRGASEKGKILASKAQVMLDYELGTPKEIYAIFDTAFSEDINSFTNPKGLYNYFKTLYGLYKSGDSEVTTELLFNKYEDISEKFSFENTKLAKNLDVIINKIDQGVPMTSKDKRNKRLCEVNSVANTTYQKNLEAMIAKESSCENLIPLYRKNFEKNRSNVVWLKRAAGRMDNKDCSDDPLFVELVEALHKENPSADSAYYLGILNDKTGNSDQALAYYEESLSLEDDQYRKASILYKISVKFKNKGRKSQARKYAMDALKFQPSMGKAYVLIAGLYADSANDCGKTQFEKRAVYWLAAKTANRAAAVDASVKKLAAKLAASYNGRAPSKTDIFTEGNAGQTITFDCWIRSSVTVPNL